MNRNISIMLGRAGLKELSLVMMMVILVVAVVVVVAMSIMPWW